MDSGKSKHDIEKYMQKYNITIKRRTGSELIVDCIFCHPPDKKGHLYFNSDTGQYCCHKCRAKGNMRTLMKHFGDDSPSDYADNRTPEEVAMKHKTEEILKATAHYYHDTLPDCIKKYLLEERGFREETIHDRLLGYADGRLRENLLIKGYSLEDCVNTGVVKEDGKDYFYKRITIPYIIQNKIKLIRGRIDPDAPRNNLPKYLQLTGYEAEIYNRDIIGHDKSIIICEGEFDCLILTQLGYNAIGIPGANTFKSEWIRLFDRYDIIYIALDNDKSGIDGATRIAKMFGEKARVIQLPEGMDVNDFFRRSNSEDDFQQLIERAKSLIEIKIDSAKHSPPHMQSSKAIEIFQDITELNPIQIAYYKNVMTTELDIGKRDFDRQLRLAQQEKRSRETQNELKNETRKEISEEEKREALALLKNPDLIELLLTDIEKVGCVGEEENKITLYLALTSRKLDDPINIIVKGESSSGKSYLTGSVAKFFPDEDILQLTALSSKALYHRQNDLSHKALIITERVGAEDSDYSIRTLQSEKKLIYSTTRKNPDTNEFETVDKEIAGPIAYIETTTQTHLNSENETRCFEIYVDESEEQTKRIFAKQNEKYGEHDTDIDSIVKVWQNAQQLLQNYPVIIPYIEFIKFPTRPHRVRRDRLRFLSLIEANCFLHQYQREKRQINGKEFLVADMADYAIAYRLANKVLSQTVASSSPRLKELVNILWVIAESMSKSDDKNIEDIELLLRDIEKKSTWDRKTIKKYLSAADREGYIEIDKKGKGLPWRIRVTKKMDEGNQCFLLSPEELVEKIRENGNLSRPVQNENGQVNSFNFNDLNQPIQHDQQITGAYFNLKIK